MKRFALVGAAGYIAPRHMHAIKATGSELQCALDPNDSIGILDSYFPEAEFFTEFECFDRYVHYLKRNQPEMSIDYMSICSPNYLHDAHIRFALRAGAHAICEKPLVLRPSDIDGLAQVEKDTGYRINTILQLRLHPAILSLRDRFHRSRRDTKVDVNLTYIASRGKWYTQSWKGDVRKAGGIATNIGVHFFDMLYFIFGPVRTNIVHHNDDIKAAGFLEYETARVRWFLSVDIADIPASLRAEGKRTYRSINLDNEEIEFSDGFTDLHVRSYEEILEGRGFGLEESRQAVETVAQIRNSQPKGRVGDFHPYLRQKD